MNFSVLKEQDIIQRQEDAITKISAIFNVSKEAATLLLQYCHWSVNDVHEQWFADEGRLHKAVGILEKPVANFSDMKEFTCGICFKNYDFDSISSAACGHPFCNECWKSYITISINDGPGCLTLRCPEPSCSAAVKPSIIVSMVSDEDREKYKRYSMRSYVDGNWETKWCPAPGCDCAIEYKGFGSYDVTCRCSYKFCWNCMVEAHSPADCDTAAKWILRNVDESENLTWILANTKPCPKCKRPIERDGGCMEMICIAPCHFQFCWLCLRDWSEHVKESGGTDSNDCNLYESQKSEEKCDEGERKRKTAKDSVERYTHYFERWAANESSRKKALLDLQKMQSGSLELLCHIQCQDVRKLEFIIEAWVQIVECRRVLKWTNAYAYYIQKYEHLQLLEFLQGEAEANLKRVHECAEKEVLKYLNAQGPSADFDKFRLKLSNLACVTRNYFENLVRVLENDLEVV